MPTENETARLAAAINLLRPDWPTASIATLLRKSHSHRPLHDVAVALVWVATDPQSATPARVNESGPWWHFAKPTASSYGAPTTARCATCGFHHHPDEGHYRRSEPKEISF